MKTRPTMALIALLISGAVLPALTLPAGAQDRPEPRPVPQAQAPTATETAPQTPDEPAPDAANSAAETAAAPAAATPAPLTFGLAGPYLAARMATVENDFRAAARYFVQAVAHDPEDDYLQDNALVALVSAGEVDRAAALAAQMRSDDAPTELSGLIARTGMVKAGDWDDLLTELDLGAPEDAEADLLGGLIRAWALLGAGRAADALAAFETLAALPGVGPMVNYHLGLARAQVGDFEGAAALLIDGEAADHYLGVIAQAQVLAQLERRDEAVSLIEAIPGVEAEPQLLALRDRLASDQPVPFDVLGSPADGIAQVYLTFASALASSPDPEPLALIHARLAAWLAPGLAEARLMTAQLLQDRQQFDLAEPEYETLRRMGEMRPVAELARIDALSRADRRDVAEKAALSLTAAYSDLPQAWIALGDLLRQQEKYAQAIPAYDKALALLGDAPGEARWFPLYARGIALERTGQFDRAEEDLLLAISLRPQQANLLNYLGYSWIDRGENLEQALGMIEQAVALSPDDGYILDSLAWAYYRLGRYADAVAPMEQAIGTMASDPLVNDHLGDIYWMVGRHREAEIQWNRALSLLPGQGDELDPAVIRDKLARGLDAVLADAPAEAATAPVPQTEADAATE